MGAASMGGGPDEHFVRQPDSGRVVRLNATAARRCCRSWTAAPRAEAVARLAERYAGIERSRLEADVLTTGRSLVGEGILVPERAQVPG